jgi:hypothetical protein
MMSNTITASDLARAAARLDRWGASVVFGPGDFDCDIRTADRTLCTSGWTDIVPDVRYIYGTFPAALRVILAATHNPDGSPCRDEEATPTYRPEQRWRGSEGSGCENLVYRVRNGDLEVCVDGEQELDGSWGPSNRHISDIPRMVPLPDAPSADAPPTDTTTPAAERKSMIVEEVQAKPEPVGLVEFMVERGDIASPIIYTTALHAEVVATIMRVANSFENKDNSEREYLLGLVDRLDRTYCKTRKAQAALAQLTGGAG